MTRQVKELCQDLFKFRDVNKARSAQTRETRGRTALINEIEKITKEAQPQDKIYHRVLSLLAAQTFLVANNEQRKLPIKITSDKQYPNFGPFFAQFSGAKFGNLLYELTASILIDIKEEHNLDLNQPFFE